MKKTFKISSLSILLVGSLFGCSSNSVSKNSSLSSSVSPSGNIVEPELIKPSDFLLSFTNATSYTYEIEYAGLYDVGTANVTWGRRSYVVKVSGNKYFYSQFVIGGLGEVEGVNTYLETYSAAIYEKDGAGDITSFRSYSAINGWLSVSSPYSGYFTDVLKNVSSDWGDIFVDGKYVYDEEFALIDPSSNAFRYIANSSSYNTLLGMTSFPAPGYAPFQVVDTSVAKATSGLFFTVSPEQNEFLYEIHLPKTESTLKFFGLNSTTIPAEESFNV
jgi:hypothetical protein